MSLSKLSNSEDCSGHSYCPHLHFKHCRKERERKIAYTSRGIKEIDLTCNVHPKVLGGLTTRNIPTLAFQKYAENPILPDQEDTNFSKNFYLQNCPEHFQMRNTLLRDVEEELATGNAYVWCHLPQSLASGATEEYNKFAKQREDHLFNARRRADAAYLHFMHSKRLESEHLKTEQAKWITDYFRRVQELIDHIFKRNNSQNEDPNLKDKLFIKQQQANNPKTMKITNTKTALDILQSLKALLLKKKIGLQDQRREQDHHKQVSASYMDTSQAGNSSQNMSAVSFISATTNDGKEGGEEHFAEKFCDFDKLQKKWGKENVQQVRNTLRVMLCRNLLNKAEGTHMREKKQAKKRDQLLRRQLQKMGKLKDHVKISQKQKGKKGEKSQKQVKKLVFHEKEEEKPVVFFKDSLSKEQQTVKSTLLRGGLFDSVGNIYERNRNYSSLFKKRGDQSMRELSFRQSPIKQCSTARTNFR